MLAIKNKSSHPTSFPLVRFSRNQWKPWKKKKKHAYELSLRRENPNFAEIERLFSASYLRWTSISFWVFIRCVGFLLLKFALAQILKS